jgi:hypothetical protein
MKEPTMKTPLIYNKRSIAYAASTLLVLLATLFAAYGIKADSSKQGQPFGLACKGWPAPADQANVEQAFTNVLVSSATDQKLRDRLLDPTNCYQSPKHEVQQQLDSITGNKVKIPKEALIIFYEDDSPEKAGTLSKQQAQYPSDHCLHILFLPPFGQPVSAPRTSFTENLMCCYKPW